MKIEQIVAGMTVKITGNSCGHDLALGTTVAIKRLSGNHLYASTSSCYFLPEDCSPLFTSRAEEALFLRTNLFPVLEAKMADVQKEVSEMHALIERLEKYPTLIDELSATLAEKLEVDSEAAVSFVKIILSDSRLLQELINIKATDALALS